MKLKTLYVRFYKSFNYDYLRKTHPDARPDLWDELPSGLFYPFVRVPIENGITTVVGANESGKSQLLSAVECLLSGEGIARRDFCRYSQFFSVDGGMKVPEFGGAFTDLSPSEESTVRGQLGLADTEELKGFHFFRLNSGGVAYVKGAAGWASHALTPAAITALGLPSSFRIDAKIPLPDSVPIAYLSETPRAKNRSRRRALTFIESLQENGSAWFQTPETLAAASAGLLEEYRASANLDGREAAALEAQYELAEKLLLQVAGIGRSAFSELGDAVKNHDGYANGIVAKMNERLATSVNFAKWWSQDSEFSLTLTLRDFDLVFTVRDRTGSEYAFSERSGGMSYFLSYLVQYLSHVAAEGPEILLMDEPDAYLSMQGQQDLLNIFDAFAEPEDSTKAAVQVVYVTHSPFLIDRNHSERIRVLEKGDGDEGTRLVANAGRNHYEPLRSALGAFVAETTFMGNCNLLLEGQADQVLLAGVSSIARRLGTTKDTLDLNSLSLVPSGSAQHIPYMAYLARGRDVDTPALVVLLDGDAEAQGVATELKKGYRGKRYVDDDLIISTGDLDHSQLTGTPATIQELEDLVTPEVARLSVVRYAHEVLDEAEAAALEEALGAVVPQPQEKLFAAAERSAAAASASATSPLRLDKVGFARAVLAVLSDTATDPTRRDETIANFQALFAVVNRAQRQSIRNNSRERVNRTVNRFVRAFLKDHATHASRRDVDSLLEDIEGQFSEVTDETERMRSAIRTLRQDYHLASEPAAPVDDLQGLTDRLRSLTYEGVRAAQT